MPVDSGQEPDRERAGGSDQRVGTVETERDFVRTVRPGYQDAGDTGAGAW
ncbi:hypothetical protein [Streptomyces sp. CBMA152]|nr:hypothetical protein [Streptomyces sp. CBMA152]